MDDIVYFGSISDETEEDLPWGKEWMNRTKEPDKPLEVITIYSGNKGLLLLTTEYKQFVFKRQKVAEQLLQALETWSTEQEPVSPLICSFINFKPVYGINKSKNPVYWHKDGSRYYSVLADGSEPKKRTGQTNPFLTQTIPHDGGQTKPRTKKPKPELNSPANAPENGQETT